MLTSDLSRININAETST